MPLVDTELRSLRARDSVYRIADGSGLAIEVRLIGARLALPLPSQRQGFELATSVAVDDRTLGYLGALRSEIRARAPPIEAHSISISNPLE